MKRTIIACAMLEDEIKHVYQSLNCDLPIVWLERGYHNTPELLRKKIQETVNELQDQDELLLCFGLCGNGTAGITSAKSRLILPRFDDCLNMLLCDGSRSCRGLVQTGTMYLTNGWTKDSESFLQQYDKLLEEYDEETRDDIIEMMYAHYSSVTVIDTGCYPMEDVMDYARKTSDLLELDLKTAPGYTIMLEKLFSGDWDENFIIVEPGDTITEECFEI
ncbi:MAG: DUF1638 domain-containing protein [Agathobacter sp.]